MYRLSIFHLVGQLTTYHGTEVETISSDAVALLQPRNDTFTNYQNQNVLLRFWGTHYGVQFLEGGLSVSSGSLAFQALRPSLVRAKQHPVVLPACIKVQTAPPRASTKKHFLGGKIWWSGIKRLDRKSENFVWNLSALYGMRVSVSGGWFGWVFVWQLAIDNVWPGHGTRGTPGPAPPHAPEHCASLCAKTPNQW